MTYLCYVNPLIHLRNGKWEEWDFAFNVALAELSTVLTPLEPEQGHPMAEAGKPTYQEIPFSGKKQLLSYTFAFRGPLS